MNPDNIHQMFKAFKTEQDKSPTRNQNEKVNLIKVQEKIDRTV